MNNPAKMRVWDGERFLYNLAIFRPTIIDYNLNRTMIAEFHPALGVISYKGAALAVQYFTGLCDEDGKEIWEGDIVSMELEEDKDSPAYTTYSTVIFKDGMYTTTWDDVYPLSLNANFIKVIGNIYENPELLKKV